MDHLKIEMGNLMPSSATEELKPILLKLVPEGGAAIGNQRC